MKKIRSITRRQLIKKSAITMAGSAFYMNLPVRTFGSEGKDTKVVLIRNKDVVSDNGKINADIIQDMLDEAVVTLTGTSSVIRAWQKIIQPDDIVGIKSNVWNRLPTPAELESAIKRRVLESGVSRKNISINDREVLTDPVFNKATALINTRPLRTHAWAGLGTLIKNYITFSDDRPSFHPDSCADLAKLWFFPQVKNKTRLNILVVLTPLFYGVGPHHYNRKYVWKYCGLLAGFDPVATDAVGAEIIKARRKEFFGEDIPINPPPKHILLADRRHHLGTADLNRIELVRLGWKEGILI